MITGFYKYSTASEKDRFLWETALNLHHEAYLVRLESESTDPYRIGEVLNYIEENSDLEGGDSLGEDGFTDMNKYGYFNSSPMNFALVEFNIQYPQAHPNTTLLVAGSEEPVNKIMDLMKRKEFPIESIKSHPTPEFFDQYIHCLNPPKYEIDQTLAEFSDIKDLIKEKGGSVGLYNLQQELQWAKGPIKQESILQYYGEHLGFSRFFRRIIFPRMSMYGIRVKKHSKNRKPIIYLTAGNATENSIRETIEKELEIAKLDRVSSSSDGFCLLKSRLEELENNSTEAKL